jgi:hypothetical protein
MRLLSRVLFAALACGFFAQGVSGAGPAPLEKPVAGTDDKTQGPLGDLVRIGSVDQMRFGLGSSQFLEAIEHLSQSLYKYGLRSPSIFRFLGMLPPSPLPDNPKPELLTYAAADQIIKDFVRELDKAEQTLAGIKDDQVKLPVHLASIRLDLKGDGKREVRLLEAMMPLFRGNRNANVNRPARDPEMLVVFDRGDVAWLRGYCHLLQAIGEFILAHDARNLFDVGAPQIFPRVETKYTFMTERPDRANHTAIDFEAIIDLVAVVHEIHLPVREPARMKAALEHLEQMIKLGRESWKFILAETDDDHEWIPNPRQKGALGVPVRQEQIDSWLEFLDEAEALLQGKRLVPFWRGNGTRGVNLRRVFLEPKTFDLVMWVQGAGALPYLEEGTQTKKEVWERLLRVFQGEFIGFAFWFN